MASNHGISGQIIQILHFTSAYNTQSEIYCIFPSAFALNSLSASAKACFP
jgi:hypothetical protein